MTTLDATNHAHLAVQPTATAVSRHGQAITVLLGGAALGMLVSGFWNVRAVDGLGLAMFVTPVIGPFEGKAAEFAAHGYGFGVLFGVLAGLAATFTASNLASFTMLPVLWLTNARAGSRTSLGRLLLVAACGVALVGLVYGAFYGRLGAEGSAAFHAGPIRSAQSFTVFGALGLAMLGWAAIEAGFARHVTSPIRTTGSHPVAVAALVGVAIGLFSIGRPLAVFREALRYAAQPSVVPYAALTGALAALATLAGGAVVLITASRIAGPRISAWMVRRPRAAQLVAAGALAAGGSFLIFYWGITRVWPVMGRWGFALGWYG